MQPALSDIGHDRDTCRLRRSGYLKYSLQVGNMYVKKQTYTINNNNTCLDSDKIKHMCWLIPFSVLKSILIETIQIRNPRNSLIIVTGNNGPSIPCMLLFVLCVCGN